MRKEFDRWAEDAFPDGFWKSDTEETLWNAWQLIRASGFPEAAAGEFLSGIVSSMRAEYGE